MRWGLDGQLIDYGIRESVSARSLALELLELVDDVVDELGSRDEVNHVHTILEKGTSSDRQLAVYNDCLANGASRDEALKAVVDHLRAETMRGVRS